MGRTTLYKLIHKDDESETDRASAFTAKRNERFGVLRDLRKNGSVDEGTYVILRAILNEASLEELRRLDLRGWQRSPHLVSMCRATVRPKEGIPPLRGHHEIPNRSYTVPRVLNGLTVQEKVERRCWIDKTHRLYDRLIKKELATEEDRERYRASSARMKFPVEAERYYLKLYQDTSAGKPSMSQACDSYCSHCPHCNELKNMLVGAFEADIEMDDMAKEGELQHRSDDE